MEDRGLPKRESFNLEGTVGKLYRKASKDD